MQGDKLAAWEELKVAAFTRAVGSAWLLPLLDLFVRCQLNILGRHLYLESAVEGRSDYGSDSQHKRPIVTQHDGRGARPYLV
jgi:peroxin-3